MRLQTKNTAASVAATVVGILCGLILPRAILLHYGTEMNGMLQAVTRFLQFSVVFDLGLSAVVPAAFYAPLAEKNYPRISAILSSSYRSFRRIALVLAGYLLLLVFLFPGMTGNVYPWETSVLLIVCTGIGILAPYWMGLPERLLLISDQKSWISYILSICVTVLTTAASLLLIRLNASLAAVKLAGSVITVLSLWFFIVYVSRHYPVSRHVRYTEEPISQKWNGVAQHIAHVVLEYTDVMLLTVMMTFREVSVYSVYAMVTVSMTHLFGMVTYSVQPKLGELWAKGEKEALNRFFSSFESAVHLATVCLFTCAGVLLVPFIRIYTAGMDDALYIQPVFSALMVLAFGFQCLRYPYEKMIMAAGHFRQTQKSCIIAACLNVGLSIIFVKLWGIAGVAAGTLAAMIYQTGYMAWYDSRVLLHRSLKQTLCQLAVDLVISGLILAASRLIRLQPQDFLSWLGLAAAVTAMGAGITAAVGFLTCKKTLFLAGLPRRKEKSGR